MTLVPFVLCKYLGAFVLCRIIALHLWQSPQRIIQPMPVIAASIFPHLNRLQALREGRVLPYREAKLTSLFKDALTGRGRLVLCVCVNPETAQFEETRRVLQVRRSSSWSHSGLSGEAEQSACASAEKQRCSLFFCASV